MFVNQRILTERRLSSTICRGLHESSDQELANCINEAFINAMKNYEPIENNIYVQCDDHESLTVNEELIIKKLQQINISKAGGPDNMPNWVLIKNVF